MNIIYTTPPEYGKQMNKISRTHIRIRKEKENVGGGDGGCGGGGGDHYGDIKN